MAIGAWAARVEIAKMIEAGVPAKEILSEIRKGEEGDFPFPPFEQTVTHSGSSTPGSSATPRPGRDTGVSSTTSRSEPPRGAPWEKPRHGSPVSVSPTSAAGGHSAGLPEWAKKGDGPRMTFRKQAVAPAEANWSDWAKPEAKEADKKSERAAESEFEYTPTEPIAELVESGIFKNFKKKADNRSRWDEAPDNQRGQALRQGDHERSPEGRCKGCKLGGGRTPPLRRVGGRRRSMEAPPSPTGVFPGSRA